MLPAPCINAPRLVGESHALQRVRATIAMVAPTNASVLVLGETGTGKELVARNIHAGSPRGQHPLISVNCAAIPSSLIQSELFGHERGAFTSATTSHQGKFEAANQSTLVLDEIACLPLGDQAQLLRVLEDQVVNRVGSNQSIPIDVRVVAMTNADLPRLAKEDKFRLDLYHRLNVVTIHLPALREHPEDIPELAALFFQKARAEYGRQIRGIAPAAMKILKGYSWPGNIRQLKHAIEQVVILCRESHLRPEDLPAEILDSEPKLSTSLSLKSVMRSHIERVVQLTNSNMTAAARLLGCSRQHVAKSLR